MDKQWTTLQSLTIHLLQEFTELLVFLCNRGAESVHQRAHPFD